MMMMVVILDTCVTEKCPEPDIVQSEVETLGLEGGWLG
jgi:hypothetical protein